jgi:plastocyanin
MVAGAGMMLALAACGSSASTGSGTGSSTGAGQSVSLEAQDFQFSPAALTLPANTAVNLTVKNTGTVHHNFTLKELGVNKDVETPGKSETVTFTTKDNATYTFYCEYHRDSKGMKGTLTVGSGGAAGSGGTSPAPTTGYSRSPVPY